MRVEVYYNLHKKTFSVRALEGENKGRVISHQNQVALQDVKFVVRESGRQKVLEEKRKNVHAFVRGNIVDDHDFIPSGSATYNPYHYATFVDTDTKEPVYESDSVWLFNDPKPVIYYE